MRHRILPAIFLLLLLTVTAPVRAADWPADRSNQIDALVEQVMQESRIPGIAVGIVDGNKAVYLKGFGKADSAGRPVTPQTPFIIGSLSKSFTAMAVMQQVEAGKVDLDAPVQRYLPWFQVADGAASAKITVRHLLNHTTGLPRSAADFVGALDDRTATESVVRQMATLKLTTAPGEQFQYCNLNYVTAALIVETVSGIPFDRYVSERILAPLQMNHSFTNEPAAIADGLALGHLYYGPLPLARRALYSRSRLGEGYIISSAEDMTRYLLAVMHGANLLSEAKWKEMLTPAVGMGPGAPAYGMGWAISNRGSDLLWEHEGETSTFRSSMAVLPGRSRALIILANGSSDPTAGVARLSTALISLLRDQAPVLKPARVPTADYVELLVPPAALLWLVWDALSLRRWRRRVLARGVRWSDWSLAAFSCLLALGFLAGLPAVLGATPALMWAVYPQLTALFFGMGGWALVLLGYRCLVIWRTKKEVVPRAKAS